MYTLTDEKEDNFKLSNGKTNSIISDIIKIISKYWIAIIR